MKTLIITIIITCILCFGWTAYIFTEGTDEDRALFKCGFKTAFGSRCSYQWSKR